MEEFCVYLWPDRRIHPVMDPEDLSPVHCELLLQVDLLERHEKMLQHITKEQSTQLLKVCFNLTAVEQKVERDFIDHFVFVYLDDILIFSMNQTDHVKQVRLILQWLLESRLFVKGEKQKFQVQTVSFLGFIVEQGRMRADPAKVRAMVEWPEPKTWKELQRFLGFANFYLRFIRDYCKVVISSVSLLLLKCCFTGLPLLNRPSTVSSSCSPPVMTRLC